MKILMVNCEYTLTGSTIALFRLAEHLSGAGHEIAVTAAVPTPGPVEKWYRSHGYAVRDLPVADETFDLAICNTILTAAQVISLGGLVKTVWWIHESGSGLEYLLSNTVLCAAFGKAAAIVFPTEFQRDAVYRSFLYRLEPGRVFVVPNGVRPIDLPAPTDKARDRLRLVSVGMICPRKRQADLIRAFNRIRQLPIKCTLIGHLHSLPDDCQALIAANPAQFELTGELENPRVLDAINDADMFCLPSGEEAHPIAVIEAATLGKPMILSDLPTYDGVWRHGRNCLTFPVGSVDFLARAIALLTADANLRGDLGAAAKRTAAPLTEAAHFARFDAILAGL